MYSLSEKSINVIETLVYAWLKLFAAFLLKSNVYKKLL